MDSSHSYLHRDGFCRKWMKGEFTARECNDRPPCRNQASNHSWLDVGSDSERERDQQLLTSNQWRNLWGRLFLPKLVQRLYERVYSAQLSKLQATSKGMGVLIAMKSSRYVHWLNYLKVTNVDLDEIKSRTYSVVHDNAIWRCYCRYWPRCKLGCTLAEDRLVQPSFPFWIPLRFLLLFFRRFLNYFSLLIAKYVRGMYAVRVTGRIPEDVEIELERRSIKYRPRDQTDQD